jgi:hypothetical protein
MTVQIIQSCVSRVNKIKTFLEAHRKIWISNDLQTCNVKECFSQNYGISLEIQMLFVKIKGILRIDLSRVLVRRNIEGASKCSRVNVNCR